MSNETFDRKEVYVGRDFGGMTYDITPDLVAAYIAGTGDDNPWYRDRSPLRGPVAPALILHSAVYRSLEWYLPNIYGNLHARQEWDLFAPVMVGESLTTRAVIVDRYIKRDREYVVNEVLVGNASGQIVSRSRTHQSFLLPDQTRQGFVVDRAREKDSRRSFKIGERSGGVWRPSPGSVYPALQQLQDEGLIQAEPGETGHRGYVLTGSGREYAAAHPDELRAPWDVAGGGTGRAAIQMRTLTGQLAMAASQVAAAGTDAQQAQASKILADSRKSLYQILAGSEDEASAQQQ